MFCGLWDGTPPAVTIALSWPEPGIYVGSWKFGNVRMMQALNNAFVFFISGLTLKNSEFRQVLTYWKSFLYTQCLERIFQ